MDIWSKQADLANLSRSSLWTWDIFKPQIFGDERLCCSFSTHKMSTLTLGPWGKVLSFPSEPHIRGNALAFLHGSEALGFMTRQCVCQQCTFAQESVCCVLYQVAAMKTDDVRGSEKEYEQFLQLCFRQARVSGQRWLHWIQTKPAFCRVRYSNTDFSTKQLSGGVGGADHNPQPLASA